MTAKVTHINRRRLPEAAAPLTNAKLQDMVPFFVKAQDPPEDHKCGSCAMRIEGGGDTGLCTIVEGPIDLDDGTCLYWARGAKPATGEDAHPEKMDYALAQYTEFSGPVRCDTCKFYSPGYCRLWDGKVGASDCCISWDNPRAEDVGAAS